MRRHSPAVAHERGDLEEEEPLVCPDEDSAVAPRLRRPHAASLSEALPPPHQPTGEAILQPHDQVESWNQAARALEVDDRDSGWNGPVAIERSDGPRPPLTVPRSLGGPPGSTDSPPRQEFPNLKQIENVRQHMRSALLALEDLDPSASQGARLREGSARRQEHAVRAAELTEARAEACQLRRELQRLRGRPSEIALLPTNALHSLQQELSTALTNVHNELEGRTKCCICREVERQVLLLPCQHLALCSACSRRVDRCPLCRSPIERYEVVVVA